MSVEQNKEIVRNFFDRFSHGDVAAMEEYLAEGYVDHHPFNSQGNRDGAREVWTTISAAFPDLNIEVDQIVAEGDTVAAHLRISGTHNGSEFLGMSPNGESFQISTLEMVRVQDGKLVEYWGMPDQLGLLQQLGAMPE